MSRYLAVLAAAAAFLLGATPAVAAQEAEGEVHLVSQTPWLEDEGTFDLLLDVRGDRDLDLQVTLHSRVQSRSAFVQTLEGRTRGATRRARLGLDELPTDDGTVRISLALPGSAAAGPTVTDLPPLRQGVYPVSVALLDGETAVDRFVTHLVRLPDDPALTPLSVAWVQPVGAAPALGPDGTIADDDRAALGVVLRALGASVDLDLTLDVTPETVAALDEGELEPLRRAVESGDQLLANPFVDVDPVALLAAGLGDDLTVQRQVGEDVLLASLGTRGDPRTWSADRTLTGSAVARLRSLGVTRLVLPETSLEPLDDEVSGGTTLTRPFELSAGGDEVVRAAAVDAGLTAHFRSGSDQVLAAHQLLADLAVLFFDFPGTTRGVVVRPPSRWQPSTAFLGTVLPALAEVPILRTATLERLFDGVDPLEADGRPVVRRPVTPERSPSLPARRLAEAHAALDELVALAGPADDLVAQGRTRLLTAESSRLRAEQRNELLASILTTRDDVEGRVQLPDRRTFRLTAREGTIPLTLVNDNPFTVSVDLVLSSDKLEFTDVDEGDRSRHVLRLDLEPGTHTRTVPVRARASGTFQVRTTLQTADGQVLRRSQFTVTSSAFSGVGVVLSIGAGLFLLLWWASHWRTVRRDRRLVEAPK